MTNRSQYRSDDQYHCGFTFLEVLLAISVAGLLLVAASQMMFAFTHLWKQVEEEPRFSHHVDGVVTFLEYCLNYSENVSGMDDRPYGWKRVKKLQSDDRLIYFRLDPALPSFVSEVPTAHSVDAWLSFNEEKGLSLLWHIPRSLTKGKIKLYETPISPWVEDVEVGTFKADRNIYEYESYMADGGEERRDAPQELRILFNQNGRKQTRKLKMRRHNRHVLIY